MHVKIINVFALTWGLLSIASFSTAAAPEIAGKIPVGRGVVSLAIDETANRIFAVNAQSKNILIIDGIKNKVIDRITTKKVRPGNNMGSNGLSYDPVSKKLFFPDSGHSFYIVDTVKKGLIKEVENNKGKNGWMSAVHVDSKSRELIALDWYGYIQTYDMDGNKKDEFMSDGAGINYYSISDDGNSMYVATGKGLLELSMKGGKTVNKFEFKDVGTPLIDKKTGNAYVGGKEKILKALYRDSLIIDSVNFPEVAGAGMAINPNTRHLFVPEGEDSIAVLNIDTLKVLARFKVGKRPKSIVVNTKTNRVYVACMYGSSVIVIQDR